MRNAIDFPIVGLAFCWDLAEGRYAAPRLVAGGVAGVPVRLLAAEALLEGQTPSRALAEAAAVAAVAGAQPLARNRYKVAVLEGLVRRALG